MTRQRILQQYKQVFRILTGMCRRVLLQLVSLIQETRNEELCTFKSPQRDITIPANKTIRVNCRTKTGDDEHFQPEVDLSSLTGEQKRIAAKMLREECHSFAKSDGEVGRIADLELEINL